MVFDSKVVRFDLFLKQMPNAIMCIGYTKLQHSATRSFLSPFNGHFPGEPGLASVY